REPRCELVGAHRSERDGHGPTIAGHWVLVNAHLMELSPVLAALEQYPFTRLDGWRTEARARGIDVIDFGVGDPREVTPEFIRDALIAGIGEISSYPRAVGLRELREAV